MDLVTAARKGREEAFLELFDEHHLPLFRFACRMTGSAADAEDIVQECFLQLLRPGCSYNPARGTPIRTYLFGAVKNQSLKRRARGAVAGEGGHRGSRESPESQVLRTELQAVVSRAVMELPEGHREVLILAHYEQMQLAEIAGIMEVALSTVKSRLQRARVQLRETLAAYAAAPERKQ